jgi:hypothetical protein
MTSTKVKTGNRRPLIAALLLGLSLPLAFLAVSTNTRAETSSVQKFTYTKILDNGLDNVRRVLLIVGEGYTKQQQKLYYDDVDNFIMKGLLGHDFFHDNIKGFNVYRADTWSNSAGPTIGQGPKKDTAFNITFNDNAWSNYFGAWDKDPKSMGALSLAERSIPTVPDHIIMLVNTNRMGHGGETWADYITIASTGDDWKTMQHEMGHAIGGLLDEYTADGNRVYKGGAYNHANSSTSGDRYGVPWSGWVDKATPVPTPFWFTPKNGIGVFVGGATYSKGTYRPSLHCRMNDNDDSFCQVCRDYMTLRLNQRNPDPNTPLAVMMRGLNVSPSFNPASINKNITNTFGFNITRSTLLGPPDGKPLPFLTPPNLAPEIVIQGYDASGNTQTKQLNNPFLIRSYPARGKKEEHTRLTDQARISVSLPDSYDPVKEGFGVRLYKVNPSVVKTEIAELKGLKEKPVVERVSEQSNGNKPTPPAAAEPHVFFIDDAKFDQMKKDAKVTLIKDFPAK